MTTTEDDDIFHQMIVDKEDSEPIDHLVTTQKYQPQEIDEFKTSNAPGNDDS